MYWTLEQHEWFAHGDCGLLAIAIHEITGWDLVFSPDWPCTVRGCAKKHDGGPHMLVRHPTGKLVDIDGMHDLNEAGAQHVTIYDYDETIEVHGGLFGMHTFNLGTWRREGTSFYDLPEALIHQVAMHVIASTMVASG